MNKIRQRFNRYGLAEWLVFILGGIMLCTQAYRYIINTLDGNALDLSVFVASFFCLFAPKALLEFIKRKGDAR